MKKLKTMFGDDKYHPKSPNEICGMLLHTAYLGADDNNAEARKSSKELA